MDAGWRVLCAQLSQDPDGAAATLVVMAANE